MDNLLNVCQEFIFDKPNVPARETVALCDFQMVFEDDLEAFLRSFSVFSS